LAVAGFAFDDPASGQTVERDTTITGPRGRSIQRKVEVQRGPGTIDRQVQIKRPGGTFERDVQISRTTAVPGRPGGFIPGPWPRPAWLPRPVVIGQPAPAFGFGLLAAPMLNFSFGGGGGGGGGGLGQGPGAGGPPPGAMGPGGGAVPPPPDEVGLMAHRLQSFHANTRKDAAYALGRMGDPRAIPSLVHVLKYDSWKDVRIAAAISLGEIGGNESAVALERSAIYDHKEEVRKASTNALARLNGKARVAGPSIPSNAPFGPIAPPPSSSVPSPFRGSAAPNNEPPATEPQPQGDPSPPPPPAPVTGGPGGS
jgi:HEAT repeats